MTLLSTTVNPRQPSTLPRNTIQNPKKDGHYMTATTRGDKKTIDPTIPLGVEAEVVKDDYVIEVNKGPENEIEKEAKVTQKSYSYA